MGKILTIILIIILVVVIIFGGWCYFFRACPSTETTTEEAATPGECEEELKTFAGEEVKLSFQYPASWGTAEEEVILAEDEADDVVAAGKAFSVTFTENPYLTISGASTDFEAGGIGGICPIRQYFNGEDEDYLCEGMQDTNGEVASCEEITIDGQNAVSYYYVPNEECVVGGFEKVVRSPITDEILPAFVIEMRVSWIDDLQMVNMGERITSGTGTNITYLQSSLDEILDSAKSEFESKSYTNYLTKLQIEQFDTLVSSIQFAD